MYLQDLHIHGFKSFAKKSELTFPAAVTAIVGPNGSGKSNVAEALRFVLGEQSVKSLRGKRGEDLIWGGTDEVARANRASIRITLNNEQRTLPLDVDVVTVERIVHRDGQNEYKLNDHTVRLKDVHELLAAGNIGPSGHHIISQGEADRVLAASPRERRAMIEEALGLKVYQFKKQEAERKLLKTQQNVAEVQNLRKEIRPHLTFLEREIKKLAEASAIKTELRDAYAEYLRREDIYLAEQYDHLTEARVTIQQELKPILKAAETVVPERQQSDAIQTLRIEVEGAEKTLRTSERDQVALEQKLQHSLGRQSVLEAQRDSLQTKDEIGAMVSVAAVDEQLTSTFGQVSAVGTAETGEQVAARWQKALDHFTTWLQQCREQKSAGDMLSSIEQQIVSCQAEQGELQAQIDRLQVVVSEQNTAYQTAQQQLQEALDAQQVATKDQYEAKATVATLQARLQQIEQELTIIERERQLFKDELQEAVALLGREAGKYFDFQVTDEEGEVVSAATIAGETRHKQLERKRSLERLKIRLETLGQGDSTEIEREYQVTKERDDFLSREIADLETSVKTLETLIADLDAQIDAEFKQGFQKIQAEFQNFFTLMFGGGTARLELVEQAERCDEEEIEDTAVVLRGVDLSVQLPNKRVQGLAMLSGGERALTSIALIFALSQINPPLFIVLDETDAALDEANSRRYGDLIEALAKRSQLLLITHNRETMSRAGVLYGVTMGNDGVSRLLSVQLDEAVQTAKA